MNEGRIAGRQADSFDPDADRVASFDLKSPPADFHDDPYRHYQRLRDTEPVKVFADGSVFLTRHRDVDMLYRHPAASSDKRAEFLPKYGPTPLYEHHTTSLVFNDPPLHTRVRRPLLGALNQRAISRMEQGVIVLVDQLLDELAEAGREGAQVATPLDLIDRFAAAIPVEVIGNLLAYPRDQRGPLRAWSLAILAALEPLPTAAMLDNGNRAVTEFLQSLSELVAARRAHPLNPEEDVLTRLIQGTPGAAPLSERELLHNCIFLLNAGHETTTNLIGNGLHALMTQRAQLERLVADPGLLTTAIEELLRFESPLQLNNRRLLAPLEIGGIRFPEGTLVTLGVGAANRDPAEFATPDRLDITRRPNRHLAFGHGDHACAGMNVARMEARIAIGRLLARFPRIALAGVPQRDRRIGFRGFSRLPVILSS